MASEGSNESPDRLAVPTGRNPRLSPRAVAGLDARGVVSTTVAAGVSLSRGASRTLWFSRPAPGARRIYPRDRVVANVKTRPAARGRDAAPNTQINNSRNRPWDRQVKMARRAVLARALEKWKKRGKCARLVRGSRWRK